MPKSIGTARSIVSPESIELMARSFLSVEDMANILDIDKKTLYSNYFHAIEKGRSSRRDELHCAMWNKALRAEDTKMQIWLSKQHLGHADKVIYEGGEHGITVNINDVPK